MRWRENFEKFLMQPALNISTTNFHEILKHMFISIICLTILWKLARRYRVQYAFLKCFSQWDTKQTRKLTRYFVLGFRWSKRAKITLETISFWQNISISIFKLSPFFYTVKVCQWNLINFSKFENALIRKKKKHLRSSHWQKKY